MKLPQGRATRVIALSTAAVVIAGAAAVADTSEVNVTLGVLNGTRSLQVTGIDASTGALAGSPAIALSGTALSAPLGIAVTDLAYKDVGYTVDATLSNLYKMEAGGVECAASVPHVPSSAFNVTYEGTPAFGSAVPIEAMYSPVVTFVDSTFGTALTDAGITTLGGVTELQVSVDSLIQEVGTALALMNVSNGEAKTFTAADAHPECGGAAGTVTSFPLQSGTPNDANLATIASQVFPSLAGPTDAAVLTPDEAITNGLLPTNALDDGGHLYEATESAILGILGPVEETLLGVVGLDALVKDVLLSLEATAGGFDLGLLGQSGLYTNVPKLNVTPTALEGVDSGLYHGVLTVTLTDDTTP